MSLPIKKIILSGLIFAGMSMNTASFAAANCRTSPIHEAFNVAGLKSELMVTALSCNAQDQYNQFMEQFRPIVSTQEGKLKQYFRSTYGRGAQKAQDDYITQLANVQSSQGLKAGTIFCLQRVDMFKEIKPLKTASDLSEYAEAKDIVQPSSFEVCEAPSTGKSKKSTSKKRTTRHVVKHKK